MKQVTSFETGWPSTDYTTWYSRYNSSGPLLWEHQILQSTNKFPNASLAGSCIHFFQKTFIADNKELLHCTEVWIIFLAFCFLSHIFLWMASNIIIFPYRSLPPQTSQIYFHTVNMDCHTFAVYILRYIIYQCAHSNNRWQSFYIFWFAIGTALIMSCIKYGGFCFTSPLKVRWIS
jgi:hypothetical protein